MLANDTHFFTHSAQDIVVSALANVSDPRKCRVSALFGYFEVSNLDCIVSMLAGLWTLLYSLPEMVK